MTTDATIHTCTYRAPSPFGELVLMSDGVSLSGLYMEGQRFAPRLDDAHPCMHQAIPALRDACAWLDSYFAGECVSPADLALSASGSEFRKRVWRVLSEIEWGEVVTYGDIAHQLEQERGQRTSAIAVGGAVGHNPIPIVVPCHRVVGASGSLVGYGCGMARKIWLLEHEGVDMSKLSVPTSGTAREAAPPARKTSESRYITRAVAPQITGSTSR